MKNLNIYSRAFILMALTAVVFLLLFCVLCFMKYKQERMISSVSKEQFKKEVSTLLAFSSSSQMQANFSNTYCTEFAKSIETSDTSWFLANSNAIFNSIQSEYVSVYDTTFALVYGISSVGFPPKEIINPEALATVKQANTANFFVNTSKGLIEVKGVSVRSTSSAASNSRGYMFFAKAWDKACLAELSRLSGAKVSIVNLTDSLVSSEGNVVSVSQNMAGLNNLPVARILFTREYAAIKLFSDTTLNMLGIILVVFLLTWILFRFMIQWWISRPLNQLAAIIETDGHHSLKMLQQAPKEFGQIGALFEKYIQQKADLLVALENTGKAESLKNSFLRNISHEIRTPMNAIIGFSDLLVEPDITTEERQRYINIVAANGVQLLKIVDDILEISSLETRQISIKNTRTNLNDLLSGVRDKFSRQANDKNIVLRLDNKLFANQQLIMVDKSLLRKVLNNLAENALKYTQSGSIVIGCEISIKKVMFYVRDTGIGIDKANIHKIFERFSQADNTDSRAFDGLGLGLSIACENASLLGGNISVESNPGCGSVFSFSIPFIPVPEKDFINTEIYKLNTLKSELIVSTAKEKGFNQLDFLLARMHAEINILPAMKKHTSVAKRLVITEI